MGKASILLSQGELADAFFINPLTFPFALAALAAIIWIITDLIRKRETLILLLTQKMKWSYLIILLAMIMGVWIWNILKA